MACCVVVARRRDTLVHVDITRHTSEARWTQTGVLGHAVDTGAVISTPCRGTVINVHLTPLTCRSSIFMSHHNAGDTRSTNMCHKQKLTL